MGKRLVIVDTCQAGSVFSKNRTDVSKLVKDIHDVNALVYSGASRQQSGLETEKVNVMLDKLVTLYEKKFKEAPKGKTFQECYDVTTLSPSDEYLEVFDNAIKTMEGIGFEFQI